MFNLVMKDFLIVKKYLLTMIVIVIGLPLFILWRIPQFVGTASFLMAFTFSAFMLCQSVALAETKYPKADALLCSTPYSRSSIVISKYIFFIVLFLFAIGIYSALSLVVSQIEMLSIYSIVFIFLITNTMYCIYMPFQVKFGYEKTKYGFMIILFLISFGLPTLHMAGVKIDSSLLLDFSPLLQLMLMSLAIIVILSVSILISIKIYCNKEL